MEEDGRYVLRLAAGPEDLRAAQRLRYDVFVAELGADGPLVDHAARLERDPFDDIADHLLLIDSHAAGRPVVGAYRLLTSAAASRAGRFYSSDEYDLGPLIATGRHLVELGRSCVHPAHRGGSAMFRLWNGLADYVLERGIEVMFGVASFHGTDVAALAQPLAYLFHHHLSPPDLRVRAHGSGRAEMDLLPESAVDRTAARAALPTLIRAYLRLGGTVGDGAFVDRAFNTVDVCLMMDTARMSPRHRDFYVRKAAQGA
jgi:L-ornithine Nalpha-acyltransferase